MTASGNQEGVTYVQIMFLRLIKQLSEKEGITEQQKVESQICGYKNEWQRGATSYRFVHIQVDLFIILCYNYLITEKHSCARRRNHGIQKSI